MRTACFLQSRFRAFACVAVVMAAGCDVRPEEERPADDATVVGQVASGAANDETADLPERYRPGEAVYKRKCALCHKRGHEGAPRIGNPIQWKNRVNKRKAVLLEHAMEGFEGDRGEMPAQGDDLSEEEVMAAIDYMLYCFEQARDAP